MNGAGITPMLAAAVLIATLAAVVALYLLRPPARRLLVSSILVWQRLLRTSRRRDERWRWWLSLALAGAIAALVAAALIWTVIPAGGTGAQRLLIVIDNSPTMGTRTTDGSTRFEQAKAQARALIGAQPAAAQILLSDTMRRIALPAFETPAAAIDRLQSLSLGTGSDVRPVGAASSGRATLHVFTDGVLLREFPEQAQIHSVFEPVENVGITRFEIRPLPLQPGRYQAFVEVENAGGSAKEVGIATTDRLGTRPVGRVLLPAQGRLAQAFDISATGSGPIRVALSAPGDGFALDDVVYGFLPQRRALRVILVTESNAYLEKSLSAQPGVRLSVVAPARFTDTGEADVYVFDRYAPSHRPSAPALLIRPGRAGWLPRFGPEVIEPRVASWEGSHPLLQHLSLRDLHVQSARPVRFDSPELKVLLRSARNEALIAVDEHEPRRLLVAFALAESNFALHADFPVFLSNAVSWLTSLSLIANRPLGLVELPLKDAKVLAMDGTEIPVRRAADAIRFEAAAPGVYSALSDLGRTLVTVNLLDSKITQVNRSVLQPSAGDTSRDSAPAGAFDGWLALILAALALLIIEWCTYQRRLTI
jgi:Ca-activated chloride channel family protein